MSESDDTAVSTTIIKLMRGVVYRDGQPEEWRTLERHGAPVSDHFRVVGVDVVVDDVEGYAYLRSRDDEEVDLPRLVNRRSLTFPVSLLLVLLRRRLAEFEATSSDTRLVLDRDQIVEMLTLFLPDSTNEARLVEQVDATIKKVHDLGFLKPMKAQQAQQSAPGRHGQQKAWEVRRVLKAYVDAQTLDDFDARLTTYRSSFASETTGDTGGTS